MRAKHLRLTRFLRQIAATLLCLSPVVTATYAPTAAIGDIPEDIDRSPVAIAVTANRRWVVSANETSDSISLVSLTDRRVVDEVPCGRHPTDVVVCSDDRTVVVSCAWSGEVRTFLIENRSLQPQDLVSLAGEPKGVAVSPDGRNAFVTLFATSEVACINLADSAIRWKAKIGPWPGAVSVTPDGRRLAVACSGDGAIYVLSASDGEVLYDTPLTYGINLGDMCISNDGRYAYFPWMVYRTNPITVGNLRRGWLLASRIGRVHLTGPEYREAISLDVPGKAVADPHGITITPDEQFLVASSSGTHELLVYRLKDLPFVGIGGPGDLIDRSLQNDRSRFYRIPTGGRPMGLKALDDDRVVTANYLQNSLQIVDFRRQIVTTEIPLGSPEEASLARKGMAIFFDGTRSLDQWYSCHSCHQNGGSNSRPMDTWNDGTEMTLKTVLPLWNVTRTAPWTWHGWQTDLEDAMHKSLTSTMLGKPPTNEETQALLAFLDQLKPPPNPFREKDGTLTAAAERGRRIFMSAEAGCSSCHSGPFFTDGQIHDVGLGSEDDYYKGYNTPSLNAVYRKTRWLHTGRAKSLEEVLSKYHAPQNVAGTTALSEDQQRDLIEYLRSL